MGGVDSFSSGEEPHCLSDVHLCLWMHLVLCVVKAGFFPGCMPAVGAWFLLNGKAACFSAFPNLIEVAVYHESMFVLSFLQRYYFSSP